MTVKDIALNIRLLINSIFLIPYVILMKWGPNKEIVGLDLERWSSHKFRDEPNVANNTIYSFIKLMVYYPEYRSVFYFRLGWIGKILSAFILYKPMSTLYILSKDIGPGLYIEHGYSTAFYCKQIGKNFYVTQHVAIGFTNETDCPTIGDNVSIYSGANVFGGINIGNNSIVGAGAVVVKNVPENCTVVGNPAYIIRRNGIKTKESL
jgi:serine O-acetyltransferase